MRGSVQDALLRAGLCICDATRGVTCELCDVPAAERWLYLPVPASRATRTDAS